MKGMSTAKKQKKIKNWRQKGLNGRYSDAAAHLDWAKKKKKKKSGLPDVIHTMKNDRLDDPFPSYFLPLKYIFSSHFFLFGGCVLTPLRKKAKKKKKIFWRNGTSETENGGDEWRMGFTARNQHTNHFYGISRGKRNVPCEWCNVSLTSLHHRLNTKAFPLK